MIALNLDTMLDIKKGDTLVILWTERKKFSEVFTLLVNPDNTVLSYWKYLMRRGTIIYLLNEEERNMSYLGCCITSFNRE